MKSMPPELDVMIDKMLAVQLSVPRQRDDILKDTAEELIAEGPVERRQAIDLLVRRWNTDSRNYAVMAADQMLHRAAAVAREFVPDPVTPVVDRLVADASDVRRPDPADTERTLEEGSRWLAMINSYNSLMVSMVSKLLITQTRADREFVYTQTLTDIRTLCTSYGVELPQPPSRETALTPRPNHLGEPAAAT